jgi:hypothetical protein
LKTKKVKSENLASSKRKTKTKFLKNRKKKKRKKCLHRGSNSGPSVYKTDALPLSYKGAYDQAISIFSIYQNKFYGLWVPMNIREYCSNPRRKLMKKMPPKLKSCNEMGQNFNPGKVILLEI